VTASSLLGWMLTAVARVFAGIAEGLMVVAETCADASELACGTGLFLERQGVCLREPITSPEPAHA
jgi:hypothetical protein